MKCCVSYKGGSPRALLGEIRERTGSAGPPFNARLIFMELQQRQPPSMQSTQPMAERCSDSHQLAAGSTPPGQETAAQAATGGVGVQKRC